MELHIFRWANYVKGVIANFHDLSKLAGGFDAYIVSTVPLGLNFNLPYLIPKKARPFFNNNCPHLKNRLPFLHQKIW